ncbi:MAG: enoyl-CoA hydratase/isomerase family protein [Deltaproteobacteria bacterium]|jgi:enoyl-CoA hydratase/carnithine racemase|nr:enoyl-CoA hydratase/isomerase family protein [Deltaproteobacteria bacterium]
MAYETITFEKDGPIGVLTLNVPKKLNAISEQLVGEVNAAMDVAEKDDDVRVIVLTGAGRAFCAGFDLAYAQEDEATDFGKLHTGLKSDLDFIMRFWRCPKPTIAAVHGYALAGGCELAVACDITIADEKTFFGEPELRFGAGIVAMILPWLTGPKQAKELILTGNDRIPAQRALEINLINQVAPEGEYLKVAMELARGMASIDPVPMRLQKMAINRTFEIMGLNEALKTASDLDTLIEGIETPDSKTFSEIARKDGIKAALKWRDSRF